MLEDVGSMDPQVAFSGVVAISWLGGPQYVMPPLAPLFNKIMMFYWRPLVLRRPIILALQGGPGSPGPPWPPRHWWHCFCFASVAGGLGLRSFHNTQQQPTFHL